LHGAACKTWVMKTCIIKFSGKTESLNVHANNMDYVENVNSIIDVIEVLKKHYTVADMNLIISMEIV
jgi:hypothetical protein